MAKLSDMSKKHLEIVIIGKFTLWSALDGKRIFIEHEDGEAGEFNEKKLEQVIDKFFKKHF